MLSFNLKNFARLCGNVTGGISDIAFFDPYDFNFTQGARSGGSLPGYSAITRRSGATAIGGASMFPVVFQENEAELTWKQSVKGCSVKYSHELVFQIAENSQTMTNFLEALDAAACCSSLGMIVRYNNLKIVVLGERYVNGSSIAKFTMKQDGSDGTSGKLFDDFNGGNIHIKGDYSRAPYEYTGSWASIEALNASTVTVPSSFDTTLDFTSAASQSDSTGGIIAVISATSSVVKLKYNKIDPQTGLPANMTLKSGTTELMSITGTADYVGATFEYIGSDGVVHDITFAEGDVQVV